MVAAYNFFKLRKEWLEKALKIIQFSAFSSGGDFKEKSKKKLISIKSILITYNVLSSLV